VELLREVMSVAIFASSLQRPFATLWLHQRTLLARLIGAREGKLSDVCENVTNPMRNFLLVSGVVEVVTGLGLVFSPSLIASILLGSLLEGDAGLIVGRVCGTALLALGIVCLLARDDSGARGIIVAMLLYDVGATALLVYSRFGLGLTGIALWPAIVLHAVLALWCIVSLRGFGARFV
jgi:hypothetical protein